MFRCSFAALRCQVLCSTGITSAERTHSIRSVLIPVAQTRGGWTSKQQPLIEEVAVSDWRCGSVCCCKGKPETSCLPDPPQLRISRKPALQGSLVSFLQRVASNADSQVRRSVAGMLKVKTLYCLHSTATLLISRTAASAVISSLSLFLLVWRGVLLLLHPFAAVPCAATILRA